ncbi:hypothetical protein [Aquabacterium sp.]|uniref:hypothetical protein n=1 Tax=Aquabacterium sp. TaxID=1872578 RepID=UPI00199E23E3|nr:hypothetical protein [Aquabacterium sp.]MBC7700511.1 hypothetical protein [Aquabacterium sp.]
MAAISFHAAITHCANGAYRGLCGSTPTSLRRSEPVGIALSAVVGVCHRTDSILLVHQHSLLEQEIDMTIARTMLTIGGCQTICRKKLKLKLLF